MLEHTDLGLCLECYRACESRERVVVVDGFGDGVFLPAILWMETSEAGLQDKSFLREEC